MNPFPVSAKQILIDIQNLKDSGFAATLKDGTIVDIREQPKAKPLHGKSLLRVKDPNHIMHRKGFV